MPTWIDFDSLVNARDCGPMPTLDGGQIVTGKLLRTDNLQNLTAGDIEHLHRLGVSDVIDLRSTIERLSTGPSPLDDDPGVAFHRLSLFRETDVPEDLGGELPGEALPWGSEAPAVDLGDPVATSYANMVSERPDSLTQALRVIGHAAGAVVVHCAAGKDRTGIVCAFALLTAGAPRGAVVADYAATTERIDAILAKLAASPTYADSLAGSVREHHFARADAFETFLTWVDSAGGIDAVLARGGWRQEDADAVRRALRG